VGCGERNLHDKIIKLDIQKPKGDIKIHNFCIGDAHYLPFKDEEFDLVILTALLEYVFYPEKVIREFCRILKKGGKIYCEVPFLQGFHSDPYDFRRCTLTDLEFLIKGNGFKIIKSGVCVGPFSALAWWLDKICSSLFKSKMIEVVVRWYTFWVKYLDLLLPEKESLMHTLAAGVYVYA